MANREQMNLAAGDNAQKFRNMLDKCLAAPRSALDSWEEQFIEDIESKFDAREDQLDMGMTPWNPSVKVWNTLHTLASRL